MVDPGRSFKCEAVEGSDHSEGPPFRWLDENVDVRLKVDGTLEGASNDGLVEYDALDDELGLDGSAARVPSEKEKCPGTVGR